MILNLRRIGTASAHEELLLYQIKKSDLDNSLTDHKDVYNGIKYSCMQNSKELITKKMIILKK